MIVYISYPRHLFSQLRPLLHCFASHHHKDREGTWIVLVKSICNACVNECISCVMSRNCSLCMCAIWDKKNTYHTHNINTTCVGLNRCTCKECERSSWVQGNHEVMVYVSQKLTFYFLYMCIKNSWYITCLGLPWLETWLCICTLHHTLWFFRFELFADKVPKTAENFR
jgi:hypothetical protein